MRAVSILSAAAAIALVLAGPLTAYARGKVNSGTAPISYYQADPQALALERQDYQAILARQQSAQQNRLVSQGSNVSQGAE